MNKQLVCLVMCFVALGITSAAKCVRAQESPNVELTYVLKNYLDALGKLESHFSNINGTFRRTLHAKVGTAKEYRKVEYIEFARTNNQGRVLIRQTLPAAIGDAEEVDDIDPDGAMPISVLAQKSKQGYRERIKLYNDQYGLSLERFDNDQPYRIKYRGSSVSEVKKAIWKKLVMLCDCSFARGPIRMADLIAMPFFVPERLVELKSSNGKKLYKIFFHLTPPPAGTIVGAKRQPSATLQSGWFVISPEEHWVLLDFVSLTYDGNSRMSSIPIVVSATSVHYDGLDAGIPTPRSAATKLFNFVAKSSAHAKTINEWDQVRGSLLQEEVFEYGDLRFGAMPVDSFTAEAFGFASPGHPAQHAYYFGAPLLIGSCAITCFIASLYLRGLAMRVTERTQSIEPTNTE